MGAGGTWQPIETAPRDGARIIGWFGDRCIIVWWRSGPSTQRYMKGTKVSFWSSGYFRHDEPDCWQPAPEPPNAAEFPAKVPQLKPRGPTTVTASPAARRRIVEKPKPRVLIEERRTWCTHCERSVMAAEADKCSSPFCRLKVKAA